MLKLPIVLLFSNIRRTILPWWPLLSHVMAMFSLDFHKINLDAPYHPNLGKSKPSKTNLIKCEQVLYVRTKFTPSTYRHEKQLHVPWYIIFQQIASSRITISANLTENLISSMSTKKPPIPLSQPLYHACVLPIYIKRVLSKHYIMGTRWPLLHATCISYVQMPKSHSKKLPNTIIIGWGVDYPMMDVLLPHLYKVY